MTLKSAWHLQGTFWIQLKKEKKGKKVIPKLMAWCALSLLWIFSGHVVSIFISVFTNIYLSVGIFFFIKVENLFNVTIHTFLNKLTLGDLEQAAGKWHTLHSLWASLDSLGIQGQRKGRKAIYVIIIQMVMEHTHYNWTI